MITEQIVHGTKILVRMNVVYMNLIATSKLKKCAVYAAEDPPAAVMVAKMKVAIAMAPHPHV